LAGLTDVARGFAGDPVPEQARVLSVTVGGGRVVNVYVVNGGEAGALEYDLKQRFAGCVHHLAAQHPPAGRPGDFLSG
jgi:exonuclease III